MGQWNVYGAMRTTGDDVAWIVEATSADTAISKARSRGMLVESAERASEPDALDDLSKARQPTANRLPYARQGRSPHKILRVSSWGMIGFGCLAIVTATVGLVMEDWSLVGTIPIEITFVALSIYFVMFAIGLTLTCIGAIGLAVRDLTQRS